MATKKTKEMPEGNVIEKSKIEPFTIGKQTDKFFILIGDKLVSRKSFKTKEDAENYLMRKPYDVIFNSVLAMLELLKEKENYEKNHRKISTSTGEMDVQTNNN